MTDLLLPFLRLAAKSLCHPSLAATKTLLKQQVDLVTGSMTGSTDTCHPSRRLKGPTTATASLPPRAVGAACKGERASDTRRMLWTGTLQPAKVVDMGKQEILAGAITDMAAVLGSEAAAEAGHYFNCGEADVIATVMALGGHKREAATWLLAHAEGEMEGTGDGDDQGDRHWVAMQVGLDAALAYVDGLTGTACSVSALGAQLDAASVETEQEI